MSKEDRDKLMEERFFLMYHLGLRPSEVASLSDQDRKWLIKRFIRSKKNGNGSK